MLLGTTPKRPLLLSMENGNTRKKEITLVIIVVTLAELAGMHTGDKS